MPRFSKISLERLETCDERLQRLCHEAIKDYDFSVLCGFRNKEEQDKAFDGGKSKLKWPQSKHNTVPSHAVDLAPYPIDWNNHVRFRELGEYIKETAKRLNIEIIWAGDWKNFKGDLGHFELK